ncbi:S41 family peptidase [Microscilla marina]|nr:S41 family peptidase [Microscilla marina]
MRKIHYRLLFTMLLMSVGLYTQAQISPQWTNTPAISPDGSTIVFSYKGDLYKVPTQGGTATLLTLHKGHDMKPVWSKDGQSIAFMSDRYGNFDIYLISAKGGQAKRLTYHSSNDVPSSFTPDGKAVLFRSSRLDNAQNAMFPSGAMSELYQVSLKGGKPTQILTTPALFANYDKTGKIMVFQDQKGYEDDRRKHHTSSVTRDLWSYVPATNTFTQLTSFKGEDLNPVISEDGKMMVYLSAEKGSINVFEMTLSNQQKKPLTQFKDHPVRDLSRANNGTLCYRYAGEIYTQTSNGSPQKVNIKIFSEDRHNPEEIVSVNRGATDLAISPNGKEVAFVVRGEIFAASIEGGTTKRITNTPEQERNISFSPDGRSILYAGERNGSWNLYQTSLTRKEEKYFFSATILKETPVLESKKETFDPKYSPDGKEVAFLEERTTLRVINLASKKVRVIVPGNRNYSYVDGDQYYDWSPDGKWFLVDFLPRKQWIGEVGLVSSQGTKKPIENLTKSGYSDGGGTWAMGGDMMFYYSDRHGMRSQASWGSQMDVYAMFFTKDAYDKFKLSKEDYALLKEREKEKKKKEKSAKAKGKKTKKGDKKGSKKLKPVKIELEGMQDRKVRLTIHSSRLSSALVSKDGKKLYYMARFEKGYNLWETNLRTRSTKILAKLNSRGGGMRWDKDQKNIFLLASGGISKINPKSGKRKRIRFSGEMVLNKAEEREYMYEHMWRQVQKKFYLKDLHKVDWNGLKKTYAQFLPHINNNHDYADMMSELLGELNASHTGCFYRARHKNADATASLGIYYDNSHTGTGLKVTEVMKGSPIDKAGTKIKAGVIIEKIDGVELSPETNPYQLLNRKKGKYTLLSLYNPKTKQRWEETTKPIGRQQEFQLRYKRWVVRMEEMVHQLSGGKVGYVHVRGMNESSFRKVYEDALGKYAGKSALIVDTRFNGGGWLHDDLATFLNGKKYLEFVPRGQNLGSEPQFKWTKPSVVVMNESNYSDAHMFPFIYKTLGIGKLVGMPVPGTGTAVWWENLQDRSLTFGIPQVGMRANDGSFLENKQLEPDIKVSNDFDKVSKGKDQQIQAAVKEMLKQIATNQAAKKNK